MKFSLLIAHYNNFDYFRDCYKSIQKQSYRYFEVIIVDDCSTDDSFAKIQDLTKGDSQVRIYENKENKGVGYTKKKCVELATGEICGFLDPDDALTEDAIETSVKAYENRDIIATYSEIYICDETLTIKKKFEASRKIKNKNPLFFNINFEVSHFFTFKKEAYLKTEGINENYKVAEDMDFYLKLYEKGNFKFIQKPLYLYRIHNIGLSHDQAKTELKNKIWHTVLLNTTKRRNLKKIYGKNVDGIENIPKFIYQKQNSLIKKILKKISW